MASMRAVLVKTPGGPEQLYVGTAEKPSLSPDSLLVKVKYSALNRADTLQRKGLYPPPPGDSEIIGLEVSGQVEEVGSEVGDSWKPGQKVCALMGGGGYAEYAVVKHQMAMRVPETVPLRDAVCVPEAFMTAYQALHWIGEVKEGQTVMMHAGASGVGTAVIQLAKLLPGTTVIVTAGSTEKVDLCKSLGADLAINYKEEDFVERVKEFTGGKGVDLLIDCIGQSYWDKNLSCMAMDGIVVLLGFLTGAVAEKASFAPILRKRLEIRGTTLRTRPIDYKIRLTNEVNNVVWPHFQSGKMRPVISKEFNMDQAADAHTYMETNKNLGKILLKISD